MGRAARAVTLLAILAFPPAAHAQSEETCVESLLTLCGEEHNREAGSCETEDMHRTAVWASTGSGHLLHVAGWEGCGRFEDQGREGTYRTRGVSVSTPAGRLSWVESSSPVHHACSMWLFTLVTLHRPCVVPPPNPGWGALLP